MPRYNSPSYRGGGGYGYRSPGYRGGYAGRSSMIRPYFSHSYLRPSRWAPSYPYRFGRPYYAFSPWLSLGFGIWAGYPVPYPWVYLGDYRPTVFGALWYGGYNAEPGPTTLVYGGTTADADTNSYGGASFDIQPSDANLFVDEQFVGTVGDFGPSREPLTMTPGQHRIAIQKDGFRPMEFDVTVEAGQVMPYRGVLERQ